MCPPIDRLGETGKNAVQSAAKHASEYLPTELLKHVRVKDCPASNLAMSDGIQEMLGVPGTGRRIRKALPYLPVAQAQTIAHKAKWLGRSKKLLTTKCFGWASNLSKSLLGLTHVQPVERTMSKALYPSLSHLALVTCMGPFVLAVAVQ